MFCFKQKFYLAFVALVITHNINATEVVSQTEVDALKGTHKQFENNYDEKKGMYGSYQNMQKEISVPPTEVKYPATRAFTQEDAKLFREQNEYVKKLSEQMKAQPEWMQQPDGWEDVAKEVSVQSDSRVEQRMRLLYPEMKDKPIEIPTGNGKLDGPLRPNENLYFFISSSIPPKELIALMEVAKKSGGTVVLRGILPDTVNIMQTSMWIQALMKQFDKGKPPKVVIDPRLFAVFNIKSAPSMVFQRGNVEVVINGTATPEWLIDKGRKATEYTDLGNISATYEVVEEDIIELLQRKYAEIDWDKQKNIARSNFFKRQSFARFPIADEDNFFELDPRIVFIKDVRAGNGKLMAKKGDVVNPLQNFEGQNRTLFIIDPRDERQKALVKDKLWKEGVGQPLIIVSHLDPEKQFQGIADLQDEFKHQIYMLQPAYIERFRISHLPVRIDIVGGKGMWMQEYGLVTLDKYNKGVSL